MSRSPTAGAGSDVAAVKRFYDRFGSRQDWQSFYEDAAVDAMMAHADLHNAHAVLEIGCGTGRLAEFLLSHRLLAGATYIGLDVSETMAGLATRRLLRFGERARVLLTRGEIPENLPPASVDRVVSTYVFDLLGDDALDALLRQAHHALVPGGQLAIVSICGGVTPWSRLVMRGWECAYRLAPVLTGYCRPRSMRRWLTRPRWDITWCRSVSRFGIASEVLVARAVKEAAACAS